MKEKEETDIQLKQNEEFLRKAYRAAVIPCMLSILSGCINILADGILVGQKIGTKGLAAINLCVPVYLILCIIGSFFVSGGAICCSQEIGNNQKEQAQKYYSAALWTCLVASLLMAVLGILFSGPIAALLCADEAVRPMVLDYTRVTLVGAITKIMIYIPFWFLRLEGKNKSVTAMMVLMGAGNVLLDMVFLFWFQMGVFGAALASVIATAAACILGFARLHGTGSSFRCSFSVPDRECLENIAAAGSPAAMNNLFQTLRLLCINALLMKYGGNRLVAVFTVINGVGAFAEAVTSGVSQAGAAMLGVYHGEHDNESARILIRCEVRSGIFYSIVFGICIVAGAGLIRTAYGIDVSMYIPMFCIAVSLIPAMWSNVLSSYYNVSGHASLANLLIFCKVFVFSVASLFLLLKAQMIPWLFLSIGELLTILLWVWVTGIVHRKNKETSRFLLMDRTLENAGKVINFSIMSDEAAICDASEKITAFCEVNGMQRKQVMRVSLALEELMVLITQLNQPIQVSFDIRVFSLQDVIGIRIRYDGKKFNPLINEDTEDEKYMGVQMIQKMVEEVLYQRTFGMNTLMVLI